MRRWLPLLALLTLSACRDSGSGPPVTTTTLLPETTVTQPATTTTLGFDIPAVIDLPYVQRVLETIYHLDGEATRSAYTLRIPDDTVYKRLEAIFGGHALDEAKRVMGENAAEGFVVFADPPGDVQASTKTIVQATPTCIIARAELDFGPVFKSPVKKNPQAVIQLKRAAISHLNPTGWGIVFSGDPDPGQDIRVCR